MNLLTRLTVLATATAATLPVVLSADPGPAHAAAKALPDLTTLGVTADRTTVAEGGLITVRHRLANKGKAPAAASTTRFYLTRDVAGSQAARRTSTSNPRSAPADILLSGSRAMPKVKPGARSKAAAVSVGVPVGTAPGTYRLLACADDRGVVREKVEYNDCTPAPTTIRVTAAPGTDRMQLPSYADTAPWLPTEQLSLTYIKSMCRRTVPAATMTPATAIARLKGTLTAAGGRDVLTRLARSGLADDAAEAQQLATQGLLRNSPGLALAGLLRAHDLEPRIGNHLINAAAIAVGLGRPNEALALLDGAVPLDLRRGAMGINPQYDALVVRGEALVMTGRPALARPLFQAVRVAEPRLSEADAGLATVEACSGKDALAARYVRRSRQRDQRPKPAAEDPTKPEPTRPAPDLDLSHGKSTQLRPVTIPDTPTDGVFLAPTYQAIDQGFQAEIQTSLDQSDQLQERLDGTADLLTQAERDRRDALLADSAMALDSKELDDLDQRLTTKIRLMADLRDAFFGGPGHEQDATVLQLSKESADACQGVPDSETCYQQTMTSKCRPALSHTHAQWRTLLGEAHTVGEEYVALASRRVSAYASNLSDDAAHDLALLQVTELERIVYSRIVEAAMSLTGLEKTWAQTCVIEPDPAPEPEVPGVPKPASEGPCPELLRSTTFNLELGVSKIKVNCDKITQTFDSEVVPWLSAFVDLTWDIRTGQFTAFAGSKGQLKLGSVLDVTFKSGVYITSDGHGGIKDVGWRVGPSGRVKQGIADYLIKKDEIDISFLAPFRTTP